MVLPRKPARRGLVTPQNGTAPGRPATRREQARAAANQRRTASGAEVQVLDGRIANIRTMEDENLEMWRQHVIEGRKNIDIAADYGITPARVSQIIKDQWARIPEPARDEMRMAILYELVAQRAVFHEKAMRGDPGAQKAHGRITAYLREMLDLDPRRYSRSGADLTTQRSVKFFAADGTPIPDDDPRLAAPRRAILSSAMNEEREALKK